jgi:hypothetical protein
VDVLSCLPQELSQTELEFFALKHSQHDFMARFQITNQAQSLQRAEEAKAIGHDDEAIVAFILGDDHENVCSSSLTRTFFIFPLPLSLKSLRQQN